MLKTIAPDVYLAQASAADAAYLYGLVEQTMRSYVDATLGRVA